MKISKKMVTGGVELIVEKYSYFSCYIRKILEKR